MCLRVLGYANEIDSKGTWPTNYIAKAQDLKLMKDIEFSSYNDGAKRGDIAILIWNMLRTPMWEVTGETEGDGLASAPSRYMLNVKFSDYAYTDKATFEDYSIEENKDGEPKVMISLEDNVSDEDKKTTSYNVLDLDEYEYAGNDFYKFAPKTEVEVLVNEEDGTLLTMVATDTDKVVAGAKDDIDDDYDELKADNYDYAYTRIVSRKIKNSTALVGKSVYVDKLEKKDDYVKINKEKYTDKEYDGELFLKDGERVELRDIELGDVLTKVTVTVDGKTIEECTFYVIGGTEEEGKFKKYEEVQYENPELCYKELTIADTKYVVDTNATFVEDPEAKTIKDEKFYVLTSTKANKMEGEIVTIKLDPIFGKVVRVTFDGEIDAGEGFATEVKFFGVVSDVDKDSGSYTIELENEDDSSDTYTFAKNSDAEKAAKDAFAHGSTLVTGAYVACKLNDEDKITEIYVVATADNDDKLSASGEQDIYYGEKGTNEKYVVAYVGGATYNDETKKIGEHKVNESTVVVKVVYDDGGTKTRTDDDEYRVEFSEGIDAVSKAIKNENVLVVYDDDSSFTRVKYVVLKTDKSDKSEKQVGTLDSANGDKIIVDNWVDITNEDDDEISAKLEGKNIIPTNTKLIVYTLRTNSKDEDLLSYVAGLTAEELNSGDYDKHGYVGEVEESGRIFLLTNEAKGYNKKETDIDDEEWADKYEDYLVVLVNVTEADDYTKNGQYEVDTFETIDYADISLEEGDRISIDEDGEVIFIIRGMEVLELGD